MKKVLFTLCFVLICAISTFAQINKNELTQEVGNKWSKNKKLYTGDFVAYYPDGKIKEKGSFKNGLYNGSRISYFESGAKSKEQIYLDGELNGESIDYFESGKIRGQFPYINGLVNGKTLIYYESGVTRAETSYDQKTKDGTYREYNEQGKLITQFETVDGHDSRYGRKIPTLLANATKLVDGEKYGEAIPLYDEIIAINPTIAHMYFNRGAAKGMIFDIDGAILDYNKAIEIDTDYKEAYANRGVAKINQYTTKGIINPTGAQCQSACEDFYKAKQLGAGAEVEDMIYIHCEKNNIKSADSLSKSKVPLFMMDGNTVEQSSLEKIDPNDILEVEVLKEKSATEKYGKAGESGVVIITTIKFAVPAYQKVFSNFSNDYKQAISKTGDLAFKYVLNSGILDGNKNDIIIKLYALKAENIESVKYNPSKKQVKITTKK